MNAKLFIRRVYLVCYDIAAVALASYMALLTRFELKPDNIPVQYLNVLWGTLWISIVAAIVIFSSFRLYTSLWTYAGMTEVLYITSACVVEIGRAHV